MRYMYLILVGTVMSLLTGCATQPVVTKIDTHIVNVPAPLLKKCKIDIPPSKDAYMQADMQGREELLTNYIIALLKDLKNCNTQLTAINTFQHTQDKIYGQTKAN